MAYVTNARYAIAANVSGVYEVGEFETRPTIHLIQQNSSTKAECLIVSPNFINTLLARSCGYSGNKFQIMSYTEIYKFKKDGNAQVFAEVKNAFRGAMAVWQAVEKRYLPKYKPSWAFDDKEYSRVSDIMGNGLKEVWALFDGDKLSETDKIVLGSTFDNVVVMKDDLPKLIEAFRKFEGETSLKEQADLIEAAYKDDDDFIGIAWNQTSVNSDAWESDEVATDEDGEEYYPPYNLFKQDKHWNLFEVEAA